MDPVQSEDLLVGHPQHPLEPLLLVGEQPLRVEEDRLRVRPRRAVVRAALDTVVGNPVSAGYLHCGGLLVTPSPGLDFTRAVYIAVKPYEIQ